MNSPLARQRCKTHPEREAAARCKECGYFFCSECCVEHGGRLVCAACLDHLSARAGSSRRVPLRMVMTAVAGLACFVALWFSFFLFGDLLASIPDTWVANPSGFNVEQGD
jgi:hypothetical protein